LATSPLSEEYVLLHHRFYPEECLEAACHAYREFAEVIVERGVDGSIVKVTPKLKESGTTIQREFLNYVLDVSIKTHYSS
jgi:hypothetical protein